MLKEPQRGSRRSPQRAPGASKTARRIEAVLAQHTVASALALLRANRAACESPRLARLRTRAARRPHLRRAGDADTMPPEEGA